MYIVSTDVKPSNVLLNTHGQVKLCDFGVSVQLLTSLTKTFIGTNAYMAVSLTIDIGVSTPYHILHVHTYSQKEFWVVSMAFTLNYGVWESLFLRYNYNTELS